MYKRRLKLPINGSDSIFLFGPRGTGKTLWVKHHLPDAIYLDLLEFGLYKDLTADPARLENMVPSNFTGWIVIDEVQKIPLLLNEVHRLIESNNFRFLLTGSSARSLKRKGVNLLSGRALRYDMHPFIQQELNDKFDLDKVLQFGLLPRVVAIDNPQKYLETYVQTYVREEVLQEGLTRNISTFAKFLELASFSQGAVVNATEIARETGVSRHIVNSYFDILEDLLLAYRIPIFDRRAKRRLISHSKFYFFDVGVYKILRPRGPLDITAEIDGAALETVFLQSLQAIIDYNSLDYKIYFWRTGSGLEVDFILYGNTGFHAFEIKRTSTITSKMLRGLMSFKQDYPEAKLHLLYNGKHRQYHNDIEAIPFLDALKQLPSILA
jgi:uncharacterized protein